MVDTFSLTLQGNNQQKASAMKPAKGKTGEKAAFSQCGGDETTTYYDRAMKKRTIFPRPERTPAARPPHQPKIFEEEGKLSPESFPFPLSNPISSSPFLSNPAWRS